MTTSAQQMRAWNGPALLTYGFRPFFLGAAVWAACAMVIWIPFFLGWADLPTRFDPVSWHAHEFLFGYLGAVVAGFLLTAVPNWTGRLPVVGWPLGVLVLLWIAGRIVISMSAYLSPWLVALVDLSMPLALTGVLTREIVAGRNWRNLGVLGLLGAFMVANALFHWRAMQGGFAGDGPGLRTGLSAALMMIALIGGRIVPSFTRNWLVKQGEDRLPVAPMQRFDRLALLGLLAALLLWVLLPEHAVTGFSMIAAGGLHMVRLSRWAGPLTRAEPLVWVLHAGYGFLPLGALMLGLSVLWPTGVNHAAAQHVWMAGAIGLMTLAVMTRATLGHTGQQLTAGKGTLALYLCLSGAVFLRLLAGFLPVIATSLYALSALLWVLAFGGFAALYGPLLMRRRMTS